MSPPPRSLRFAVSTSLLTASLSLAGCDEPKERVNTGPINQPPQPNADGGEQPQPESPQPESPQPEPPQPEPPPPEPIHVNEGPEPVPEPPPPPDIKVNPGPEVPVPEPIEPKRVNTRPEP